MRRLCRRRRTSGRRAARALQSDAPILQTVTDPAAGPNTAHYELLVSNGVPIPPYPPTGNFLGATVVLLTPTSRGSITLNSAKPLDAPLINPNLLGTDFDKFTVREAIRAARRFVGAPAWTGYAVAQLNTATTDAELDAYVAGAAGTIFHPVGTAAMSPKGASYGVVDPDLKVKGASGLRIVDASVI
ncbi:hypothetical protein NLJ89_g9032 [Agrocybe chaxingu]|uniref:Glucose-methanol-choline oxidoreductase C-terminal domain-containing protein n=1 Tax=Agrocybe chaxingu TaxID=84603 RepID=A0A9W8JT87_9AGAR|nr:hypothetical protein NLJ89_g9032 [Agrocybe chaxingu]